MGWTVRLEPSRVGHSGHVQDVPGLPGTLGRTVGLQPSRVGRLGCVWDVPGTLGWDGTVGLEPSRVGHSGHVQDVPGLPGTLGWDGQWDCSHLEWEARDVSGMSLGLWDGMDSGIAAI